MEPRASARTILILSMYNLCRRPSVCTRTRLPHCEDLMGFQGRRWPCPVRYAGRTYLGSVYNNVREGTPHPMPYRCTLHTTRWRRLLSRGISIGSSRRVTSRAHPGRGLVETLLYLHGDSACVPISGLLLLFFLQPFGERSRSQ